MKMKKLIRVCEVCGNPNGEVLHSQRFVLPEGHPLPASYDIVSCARCGFVFADTRVVQDDYDSYYAAMSKYEDTSIASGGGDDPLDAARLERTASDIARFAEKKSAILDIGCANGGLLNVLKQRGYDDLTGIDPSLRCVENASAKGLRCSTGGVFDLQTAGAGIFKNGFDCVILSHVLEHVLELGAAIKQVLACLKNGGMIYAEVPDAASYHRRRFVPFYYIDCEHINHFDRHSLDGVFLMQGCRRKGGGYKDIRVNGKVSYPAIYGVYEKNGKECPYSPRLNSSARRAVRKHITWSMRANDYPAIDTFAESGESLIVWGAGQFTLRLLENSRLRDCHIVSFIDNDSRKHGRSLAGASVEPPSSLINRNEPILICVAHGSSMVRKQIIEMHVPNRVVTLD